MLIKIPLLIALIYAFIQTSNVMLCSLIWGAAVLVLGALFGGLDLWLLAGAGISFLLAFGFFSLLEYLEGSKWWWPAMFVGLAAMILVA
ncbi:hypothetical protein [Microbulbifer halophilus]|uniref:Uncharacterized protein n=1 Tax=Microbulbifer halophilus TaxID=453963 RepID=A0ABW5EBJ1_9GAMM|nr:hypothetical protein [Microbulbifer halophilus]MCW8125675.1 hypothetical protein [Microbulbifer halophilus]